MERRRGLGSPGWLGFHDDARFPCMILDISDDGAKLGVSEAETLPANLRLYFSPTAQTFRRCIICWRTDDSIGVQFKKQRR